MGYPWADGDTLHGSDLTAAFDTHVGKDARVVRVTPVGVEATDTAAIAAAITSLGTGGGTVEIGAATAQVTAGSLTVTHDDIEIKGVSPASVLNIVGTGAALTVTGNRFKATNLGFTGATDASMAFILNGGGTFSIERCRTSLCRLLDANASQSYASAASTGDTVGISVTNCTLTGPGVGSLAGSAAAIQVRYAYKVRVAGNTITGYNHGLQWWGGDANSNNGSALKFGDLTVADNVIYAVGAGGIWGSMGERISVTGNTVRGCGDVGIDFEGSTDFTASGNVVADCTNGGLTCFYGSTRGTFAGNAVNQGSGYGPCVKFFGSFISTLIVVSDNILSSTSDRGIVTDAHVLTDATFSGNIIRTVASDGIRVLDGAGRIRILGNDIYITTATGKNGISLEGPSHCTVMGNTIRTGTDASVAGFTSAGVRLYWRSSTYPTQFNTVRQNVVEGFVNSILDDCWSDFLSYNMVADNRADNFAHRGTTTWTGFAANNQSASSTITAGYASAVDVQSFTSDGTWTKPTGGFTRVKAYLIGGGGGGGSGRAGATSTVRCGGGGGGGGGVTIQEYPIALLGSTVSVTVGLKGTGGTAVSASDTDGNPGTAATHSAFGLFARAGGGGAGAGGTATAGAGATGGGATFNGGNGSSAQTNGNSGVAGVSLGGAAGGGAAAAGVTSGNSVTDGAAGASQNATISSGTSGRTGGAAGTSGGSGSAPANVSGATEAVPGAGGGSGASSIVATSGSGGAGGLYGGGGGGGAATLNTHTSGAGGAGADGIVVIITY